MKVKIKRASDDNGATLGILYLDGLAICGNVEPTQTKGEKVSSGNRIQEGTYKLSLRDDGGYNRKYKSKYNRPSSRKFKGENWHRGMLCVHNSDDWKVVCENGRVFQFVLFHTGNTKKHTLACSLPNYVLDFLNDTGGRSADAYEYIYPILRDAIEASDCGYIDITYTDIEEGR